MSREVTADECLRVSGDPNEFLRMIGQPVPGDEGAGDGKGGQKPGLPNQKLASAARR
jgi:twitching motility protein PilT